MLIAAAVCPHPPLLIPQATGAPGAGDTELRRLRTACHQAVSALLAERPDLIAVVGADPGTESTAEYPPRTSGRLHDFGVPFAIGEDHGPPSLPLSLTIGKWLLSQYPAPRAAWWGIASDAPPGRSWPARRARTPSAPSCATAALPSR
jgi:hypothetical protein